MERVLKENVRVSLVNKSLWNRFNKIGTEMILTKSGRRMFPFVEISIQGLEPETQYMVTLDIASVDGLKYRYDEPSNRWNVTAASQSHSVAVGAYLHPASPRLGRELTKGISFNKVKLNNNRYHRGTAAGQIFLQSMFLYVPRLYILTTNDFHKRNWDKALVFKFKETEFMAVTAYMNRAITQLKIESNPFARAFREDGQYGVKIKKRRTGSPWDEGTKKPAVNNNNADEDDSSPQLQRIQQEQTETQPFMYRIQVSKGDDEIQVFHVSPSSIIVTDFPPSALPLPNSPSSSSSQTIQYVSSDETETQDRAPSPQFPPPSVSDQLPMIVSVGSIEYVSSNETKTQDRAPSTQFPPPSVSDQLPMIVSVGSMEDVSSDVTETQDRAPSPQFPPASLTDQLPMIASVSSLAAIVDLNEHNATKSIEVMSDDDRLKGIYHEMYKFPQEKDVGDSRSDIEALSQLAQGQDSAIATTLISVDASKEVQDAHIEKMPSIIKHNNLYPNENVSEDRARWLTSSSNNVDNSNLNALQSLKDTNEDNSNLLHCNAGNTQSNKTSSVIHEVLSSENIRSLTYDLQQPLSIDENPSTSFNVSNTLKTASKSSNCTKERSSSLNENVQRLMSDIPSNVFSECEPSEDVTFIDLNSQRYSVSSESFPYDVTQSWFDDSFDNQPNNCSDNRTRGRADFGKDGSIIVPGELSLEMKAVIGKDKRTQVPYSKSFGHLGNTRAVQGEYRPASPITARSIPFVYTFSRDLIMQVKSKAFGEPVPSKVIPAKSQPSHSKSEPEKENQTSFLENAGVPIQLLKDTNVTKLTSASEKSCLESQDVMITQPKVVAELLLPLKKEAITNKQSNSNGEESNEINDVIDMVNICCGDTQTKLALKNDNRFENSKVDLNDYFTKSNVYETKYDDVNNHNNVRSDIKRNSSSKSISNNTISDNSVTNNKTVKDINRNYTNDFTVNGLHRECDRDQMRPGSERSEEIISYSPGTCSSDNNACLHRVSSPGIVNLQNEANRKGEFVDENEETSQRDTLEVGEESWTSESRNFEKARVSSSSEDRNSLVLPNSMSFPELNIQDTNPTAAEQISQEKNALADITKDYTKSGRKNNENFIQAVVSRGKYDDDVFNGTVLQRTEGAISFRVNRNVNNASFVNTLVTSSPQQPLTSSTSYTAGTLEPPPVVTAAEISSPYEKFKERTLVPLAQPLQKELIATESPSFLQQPLNATPKSTLVSTLHPSEVASAVRELSVISSFSLSVPSSASMNPSLLPNMAQSEGPVQTSSKGQQNIGPQENFEAPSSCMKPRGCNRGINLTLVTAPNASKRPSVNSGPSGIQNKIARVEAPAPRNGALKLGLHQKPGYAVEGLAKDVKITQAKEQIGIVSNRSSDPCPKIVLPMAHKENKQEAYIQPPGSIGGSMDGSGTKRSISNFGQEDNMIRQTQRFRQQHENEITAENQKPDRLLRHVPVISRTVNVPEHIPGSIYHIPTGTGSLFHATSASNSVIGEQSTSIYSNTTNCLNDATFPHADVPADIKTGNTSASGFEHELEHGNIQEHVLGRRAPSFEEFANTRKYRENCAETNDKPMPPDTTTLPNRSGSHPFRSQGHIANFHVIENQNQAGHRPSEQNDGEKFVLVEEEIRDKTVQQQNNSVEEGLGIQNSTSSRCQHANETESSLLPDNRKRRYDYMGCQGDGTQRDELIHRSLDLHQDYQYNMERNQKATTNDKGKNLHEDDAQYSTLHETQSRQVILGSRAHEYDYFSAAADNRRERESEWLPEERYYHHKKRTSFDAVPLEVLYNFQWPTVDRRMPDARLSEIYSATRSTFTYYSASLMCSTIPLESKQQP